jgi:hypothetical protein
MKLASPLLLLILSLLSSTVPSLAWEGDVHLGLTWWLALKAGFPNDQAKWIADGDQGVDESPITDPVHSTIKSACTGPVTAARITGSSEVHDHHFPSPIGVPSQPKDRYVKPGVVQRQGSVNPAPRLSNLRPTFNDFGKYLHALQDTWSHQGIPDFPDPPCNQQLGWGHAFSRGGWACHLADLTYKWQYPDVLEMAKGTYDELVAQKPGSAESWSAVEPDVKDFAAAHSKWEKHDWFRKRGFADQDLGFLQEISLPDCASDAPACPGPYPFQQLIQTWSEIVGRSPARPVGARLVTTSDPPPPPDFTQLFVDFIDGLLTGGASTPNRLLDHELSRIALQRALHLSDACPELVDRLQDTLLNPGFLAGLATHNPTELCEAAYQASKAGSGEISCDAATDALLRSRILRQGPSISDLAPEAARRGLPIFILSIAFVAETESYFGFVRFIHLPRDILVLGARRISGAPRIISAMWAPDQ